MIITFGMNKEDKLKNNLINTNRIILRNQYNTIIIVYLDARSKTSTKTEVIES